MPKVIGYNYGRAGNIDHTSAAPTILQSSSLLPNNLTEHEWQMVLSPTEAHHPLQSPTIEVQRYSERLAALTAAAKDPLVIGGDHTAAIGTWSGVQTRIDGPLGLIWIDAHLDAHTQNTSQSGNLHGMPLAVLLGHGQKHLMPWRENSSPILQPNHVHILGFRSYEPDELALLKSLGVHLWSMAELRKRSLQNVFANILISFAQQKLPFGISLDIDGIDPQDAPAVTVPEPDGIRGNDLLKCFSTLPNQEHFLGLEIVEFAPKLDQAQKTEKLVIDLIRITYGDQS